MRRDGQVRAAVASEVARRDDGRIDLASQFDVRQEREPALAVTWSKETESRWNRRPPGRSSGPPPKKVPVVIDEGLNDVPREIVVGGSELAVALTQQDRHIVRCIG